ncbi:unnamed protein product [Rotaria sp. Silwood1]|nr:unnamed protein product [Rotaria sp. Silwood1]
MDAILKETNEEATPSSTNEENQDSIKNEIDSSSPLTPIVSTTIQNDAEKETILNSSSNVVPDIEGQQNETQLTGSNRKLSSSRLSFNKFKEQLTQHARTVMTIPPALTSILTNTSSTNNNNDNINIEQVYWAEICIERAKDLAVKDINGSSDPYVKVLYGNKEKYITNTVSKNLNPVWNEKFIFFVHDLNIPLYFNIFDHDRIGRDDPMGTTKIDLYKVPLHKLYSATLELQDERRNDGKTGTIKISITMIPKSIEFRDEIKNGEKKWIALKDRKCMSLVKGAIEIEATFIYTNLKAVIRTFNPRQQEYYQITEKFSPIVTLVFIWNFELYMLPCILLFLLARNVIAEYRRNRLRKSQSSLDDETISDIVQPAPVDEEILDDDINTKEQKVSFTGVIQSIQDTVMEIQGYIDSVASTLERIKNLFNFAVPWLSILFIILLILVGIGLYYIPLRYLIIAVVIREFTKRFGKPKDFTPNNELADFMSRLPSDIELMRYRELKVLSPSSTRKINKRSTTK